MIDSWAWIEYFMGSDAGAVVRGYIDDDQEIVISTINLSEVYRWILRYYDEPTAEEKRLAMRERCILIDVDEEVAVSAAKIKHDLKWGLGDSIVYATAKLKGSKVVTGDSDFKGMEDVIFLG
ncbi:MAG: type II toxin-antitoxin system VapC family toxin [Methanothrix sp.]|nr:type II toxin-antitoxin system VapC family toxin [Methanothrix sp.]